MPSAIPVSDVGRNAPTAPATSSRFAPLELRDVREGDAPTPTLPSEGPVAVVDGLGGGALPLLLLALLLKVVLPPPNAVEPNVLPATANVDVIGVK